MTTLILTVHLLAGIFLVLLVLLQKGKGADAGAGFGAGASGTVFGARGASSFLSRATAILATVFFITSLTLGFFANQTPTGPSSIMNTPSMMEQVTLENQPPATPENTELPPLN